MTPPTSRSTTASTTASTAASTAPRTRPEWMDRLPQRGVVPLLLALVAYLPALGSSPGRMPADTKLFLYTDPAALLSDARWSYDAHQYGGWVTHQFVSYLWPSGPWFWLGDRLGLSDWVTHRLWIGTLFFLAGLGMAWFARQVGLRAGAALVAALAYQCTPYVLPYVSRTSVMLLPWVGLPWLVGLTRRAVRHGGWRDAAACGVVVLTVGGVNLTATAMIVAGPVLWLVHEGVGGAVSWQRVRGAAARIGVVTTATSAWWLAAVWVQGRYGGDVLTYSETFGAVTRTASGAETLRGHGYWLGYVDSPVVTTTMTRDYQHAPVLVALGFALAAAGILGLALVQWSARRFAAWVVAAGVLLASVAHVAGDASPVAALLRDHSRNQIVLGLRSSTRAVPLVLLGLGLGLGALVQRLAPLVRRPLLVPTLASLLVLVNVPALWSTALVDPANDRVDEIPADWLDVAEAVDTGSAEARVLQLPGAEFAAHTWGVTNEPVLAGLSRRSLLTRDLIPLGSPGLMDAFYALDDRIQAGTFEPEMLLPMAAYFGADTIVVPLDLDAERYGTFPPARFDAALAPFVDIGALVVAHDGPAARVYRIVDPGSVVRTKTTTVVVVGDGSGLVDAAAAGLLTGAELLVPVGTLDPDEPALVEPAPTTIPSTTPPTGAPATVPGPTVPGATAPAPVSTPPTAPPTTPATTAAPVQRVPTPDLVERAAAIVLTDQDRKRAHHWRTSQDVVGLTEVAGEPALLRDDDGDYRLDVFPDRPEGSQTVARFEGEVRAVATGYGSPVSYRPEDRAAQAIDGDPTTAWRVGRGADPVGEFIRLELADARPFGQLRLRQPLGDRRITRVTITVGSSVQTVELPDDDVTIALDTAGAALDVRIDAVEPTSADSPGSDGVGFSELSIDGATGTEVIVLPTVLDEVADSIRAETALAVVLTRERVDRPDRDRTDPETHLVREVTLPAGRTMEVVVTARPLAGAPDIDTGCRDDLLSIDGAPVPLRVSGPGAGPLAAVPCGITPTVRLDAGVHLVRSTPTSPEGFTIDRVVLRSGRWPAPAEARPATTPDTTVRQPTPTSAVADATAVATSTETFDPGSRTHLRRRIEPCPLGCWLVLADGLNDGWRASIDGGPSLGAPRAVDAGMNGWWLPPSDAARVVTFDWQPQRITDIALLVSGVVGLLCLLGVLAGRRPPGLPDDAPAADPLPGDGSWPLVLVASIAAALVISPVYGALVLVVTSLAHLTKRWWMLGATAGTLVVAVGLAYVARIVRSSPVPGFGWIDAFQWGHRPVLAAVLLLAAAVSPTPRRSSAPDLPAVLLSVPNPGWNARR